MVTEVHAKHVNIFQQVVKHKAVPKHRYNLGGPKCPRNLLEEALGTKKEWCYIGW